MADGTATLTRIGELGSDSHQPGRAVHQCVLAVGTLSCTVWTYGATLVELWLPDRLGRLANVVLRLPELADYQQREDDALLGSTMGRYCRVIGGGRLVLDGQLHQLDRNAGGHHLHGGRDGFDRRVWEVLDARGDEGSAHVTLGLHSPAGDQGYPADLTARTTYRLGADATLRIIHEASASASTIVALTTHGYWNLAGHGTIDDHELRIAASRVLVHDADLLPAEIPAEVAGGPLDYTAARPIGPARLDNCFLPDGDQPVAWLRHPSSGRELTVETSEPGFAVYTADNFRRRRRGGVCLQSTALPDAPNKPAFPPVRLAPGQHYRHEIVHRFRAR